MDNYGDGKQIYIRKLSEEDYSADVCVDVRI